MVKIYWHDFLLLIIISQTEGHSLPNVIGLVIVVNRLRQGDIACTNILYDWASDSRK